MGVWGIYEKLAYVYDHLTRDINRKRTAEFIEDLFRKHGLNPRSILDLGCGTGVFAVEMCKRGYSVTGVDLSTDMLSCAKTRITEEDAEVFLINQDMTELELNKSMDAAVCLVDGVNHITDPQKVERFFLLVFKHLKPGGLFIFDVNTRHKLETVMGDKVFYSIDDDVTCLWQSSFDASSCISESDITLFIKKRSLFERFDEVICERAYENEELRMYIINAGFGLVDIYDGETLKQPGEDSERLYYVCRK